jgi:hypothetical protein
LNNQKYVTITTPSFKELYLNVRVYVISYIYL